MKKKVKSISGKRIGDVKDLASLGNVGNGDKFSTLQDNDNVGLVRSVPSDEHLLWAMCPKLGPFFLPNMEAIGHMWLLSIRDNHCKSEYDQGTKFLVSFNFN